jgi:hypothetical protein
MEMAYYDKWILELFQGNLYVELKWWYDIYTNSLFSFWFYGSN